MVRQYIKVTSAEHGTVRLMPIDRIELIGDIEGNETSAAHGCVSIITGGRTQAINVEERSDEIAKMLQRLSDFPTQAIA